MEHEVDPDQLDLPERPGVKLDDSHDLPTNLQDILADRNLSIKMRPARKSNLRSKTAADHPLRDAVNTPVVTLISGPAQARVVPSLATPIFP